MFKSMMTYHQSVRNIQLFRSRTNIPQQRDAKLYQLYLPYQRSPRYHSFFVLPTKFPFMWLAKRILLLVWDVEWNCLRCVPFSAYEEVCCTELFTPIAVPDYGQTPSKWFLCWTRGRTYCRHSIWVSWSSSLKTWEEGSNQQQHTINYFCKGTLDTFNFIDLW